MATLLTPDILLQRARVECRDAINRAVGHGTLFASNSAVLQAFTNGTLPRLAVGDLRDMVSGARGSLSAASEQMALADVQFNRIRYLESLGNRRQSPSRRRDVSVYFRHPSVSIEVSLGCLLSMLDRD